MRHLPFPRALLALCLCSATLFGCATSTEAPVSDAGSRPAATARREPEAQRASDAERQAADRLRLCQEEKRRTDLALRDSQRRTDDLQKRHDELQRKLDALLAIDREVRARAKNH